jgi:hypothetical protein
MLAISNTIFNEASGLVKDWLKNPLNASFFYWYFLPALGLVLLQAFFVWPLRGHETPSIFPPEASPPEKFVDLLYQIMNARLLELIIAPLLLAVGLSALAGSILRMYQGNLPGVAILFRPALMRKRQNSAKLYSDLGAKRRMYFFLVSQGVRLKNDDGNEVAEKVSDTEREQLLEQLKAEIQGLHERLEQTGAGRELPINPERVGATDLANVLAVAEEYPFERYSIDTAVFWPRFSAEIEPQKMETLTSTFGAMNGFLNLSLLSYLFAIECLILAIAFMTGRLDSRWAHRRPAWLALAIPLAVIGGFAFYRAATRTARSVGNELRTAFDYYRGQVLRRFNLRMPKDIEEERVLWLKLAAFIRRGESFYYPSEYPIE